MGNGRPEMQLSHLPSALSLGLAKGGTQLKRSR